LLDHCCRGNAISFAYSECVCSHAKCLRRIILSSVACPAVQCFSTLCHITARFGGGGGGEVIEHKILVLIFSTNLSEHFLILKIIRRDIIINYIYIYI